jgi:hypothetical protein
VARELPHVGPLEGGRVFRVSRDFDVFAPPDWSWAQEDGTFGNRFDDPGKYRGIPEEHRFWMVYCATQRAGAFGETIARFRRSPRLAEGLRTIDDEEPFEPELEGGVLQEEWRLKRRLGSTRLDEGLIFADFASAETFQILTEELAPLLVRFGLTEFDLSLITSRRRRVTQEAARYAYELAGSGQVFAGVHYLSRLNPAWELRAVFHDRMVHSPEELSETVREDEPGLVEAASVLGIEIQ